MQPANNGQNLFLQRAAVECAEGERCEAGACVSDIIKAGVLPVAIEYMDRMCIEVCEAHARAGYPMCEALLIVEVEGAPSEIDEQLALIKGIAAKHKPVAYREAQDADDAGRIWLGRKSAFGAMGQVNDYMCLDGTVPVSKLPEVLRRIGELSKEYGLDVGNVFHAGDGNFHMTFMVDPDKPEEMATAKELAHEMNRRALRFDGTCTGEHGVGIGKQKYMAEEHGEGWSVMADIKRALDPNNILNPGKVIPAAD